MMAVKFDEYDRKKVIAELEKSFQVKLSPIGRRRKYLRDTTGRRYCVFGGYGDWHGIPEEIVEEEENLHANEENLHANSVLVIAKKYKQTIDIYYGALREIIEGKSKLAFTKDRQYEFNIKLQGSRLLIKEIPGLSLRKLGETPYSETEKVGQKTTDELLSIFRGLSSEKKEELLRQLSEKLET